MNWKAIEQAILDYVKDRHEIEVSQTVGGDECIVDPSNRERWLINISELARAIERAVTVRVD